MSLPIEGEQLKVGGGMVEDFEEDAEFAAWLEAAVIVADNLTEKEIENGALPVNGLPIILLPIINK